MTYKYSINKPLLNRCLSVNSCWLAVLFFVCSCSSSKKGGQGSREKLLPISISQGIAGTIVFKQGEFDSSGKLSGMEGVLYGVQRKIYVYRQTSIRAVDIAEGDFVNNVYEPLIDSLESTNDGYFEKKLAPGKYSLFIMENHRLYAKPNEKGIYSPVTVKSDSVSMLKLEIDYQATY